MKLFSERMGYKPVREAFQIKSIDDDLRNGLWDVFIPIWKKYESFLTTTNKSYSATGYKNPPEFLINIWMDIFKLPRDTIPDYGDIAYDKLRKYFFDCEWHEVYTFLEYIVQNTPFTKSKNDYQKQFNIVLEKEMSGYRFVDGIITQITDKTELSEIQEALENTERKDQAKIHLQTALTMLSDRKNPDYRNSIKESISAVEAVCNKISGAKSSTLGEALNKIHKEKSIEIHPALLEGFNKIYGYTSDADGIRHALTEDSSVEFEDAKFWLVSCSAFVNYLNGKSIKKKKWFK